ncbi:pentatricopeptide repeat-containing protein At1g18900 [Selaginella moellendorffii]|uniref:pentatricopeptide repeat-containing protein At1g18900 n=1 Tax=Selaginella moellendorffii TaxID=88036 RepID=UPI000D1C87EB|nr:pentatricopeptide repeat-containing protein At1g18900 [Selaginella moellendorffii]|eukprot:XP_024545756.1 pentatricopeptide repeat-containing protein At1g18900 [Selaginella moellendorffii]
MLRSAKLLPLCKGARNWLVAGTVYGPKATGDASNSDDNRRDEAPDSRGYENRAPPYNRHGRSANKDIHTHSSEPSATKKFAPRDTAFRQNFPRPNHARGYPELGQTDGLASVGRYSVEYKSSGSSEVKKTTKASPQSSSNEPKTSTFAKASGVEQEDANARNSSETMSCTFSSEPVEAPAAVPVFGSVPSLGDLNDFEKPVLSFQPSELRRDTSFESAKTVPAFSAPELQKDAATTPSFTPASSASNAEPFVPRPSSAASSDSSLSSTEVTRTKPVAVAAATSRNSDSTVSSTTHTSSTATSSTTPSTNSSNFHRKSGGQAKHGHHHHRNNRSNSSESHRLVARVCGILNQHGWGDETVRALAGLNANLNAYQVNEILKQQKEAGVAYNFFIWARKQAGFKHDVHTYTTILGILGRAKSFDVLNNLLDEMIREGCEPNVVTYNRLIHCYGRANDLDSSLKLFNVMQMVGCEPDRVTYCTLIDLQAKAGFHDAAMDLYRQMQHAGFRPDTFTYSIIIHCLGKAGKLNAAYKLFCEMTDRGYAPSLVTYNIIIDLHAKAGKFDMALKLYSDLQEVGYAPDRVTYGIIMEVLGNCGHIEDAEQVFEEMERAGWVADNPIFGLMVDMWGKTGNAEKAAQWFNRMLDSGLQPNVPACNSLLSAYLRSSFYDAAGGVLGGMAKWGLYPTLQTYTSLLSSCAACRAAWEYDALFGLMGGTGHPAHPFVCSLLASGGTAGGAVVGLPYGADVRAVYGTRTAEMVVGIRCFFDAMQFEELESRRGFADSLIDFLHRAGKAVAAGSVWEVAAEKNLYPNAVREKAPQYWSINLHVMSTGTALVALARTLAMFAEAVVRTGAAPYRIDIITGWGRRSRVPGASLVKQAVEGMLRSLNSPFHLDGLNVGCFVGQGPALAEWLKMVPLDLHQHHQGKFA